MSRVVSALYTACLLYEGVKDSLGKGSVTPTTHRLGVTPRR